MKTATIREVQHNFAAYVRRAEAGERTVICRRSKIVARLEPNENPLSSAHEVNWGEVRERRERLWGKKQPKGKPLSEIVSDSRGDH